MTARPALLLYCQHSLGLGHLARSWVLADALARDFEVVVLCGGPMPAGMMPPPTFDTISLPPLGLDAGGRLTSLDSRHTLDEALEVRHDVILKTYHHVRPSVLVIELFPFGRKKFARELLPLLEAASGPGRPLVVCSLRDILVSRGDEQAEHDDRARRLLERYFDVVLVHADPALIRLEESFRPRAPLTVRVHYTGFVVAGFVEVDAPRAHRVVVSAGGGRVGEPLLHAAVEAHAHVWRAARLEMHAIAGPFLPEAAWTSLARGCSDREGLRLDRSVPALRPALASAAASVSQFGYNTALDVVRARVPALVVPYADGGEDEQMVRARRLEQLGAVRVLAPDRLSGNVLAAEILETLRFRPRQLHLDLDGASRTRQLVRSLVEGAEVSTRREVTRT